MVGGIQPVSSAIAQAAASIALAAPMVCPIIDLIELSGTFGARSANSVRTAMVSTRSLVGVPVPCALM